jgi:hypothetical protein
MAKEKKELSREQRIVANAKAELAEYSKSLGIELDENGEIIAPLPPMGESESEEEETE